MLKRNMFFLVVAIISVVMFLVGGIIGPTVEEPGFKLIMASLLILLFDSIIALVDMVRRMFVKYEEQEQANIEKANAIIVLRPNTFRIPKIYVDGKVINNRDNPMYALVTFSTGFHKVSFMDNGAKTKDFTFEVKDEPIYIQKLGYLFSRIEVKTVSQSELQRKALEMQYVQKGSSILYVDIINKKTKTETVDGVEKKYEEYFLRATYGNGASRLVIVREDSPEMFEFKRKLKCSSPNYSSSSSKPLSVDEMMMFDEMDE